MTLPVLVERGKFNWGNPFKDEVNSTSLHSGRGVLSIANSGLLTNGSQFFIAYKSQNHLNPKHTVLCGVVGGPYTCVATESWNLSSYFSSLALTEIESEACSQAEASTVINQDIRHQKLQYLESDGISKSYVNMPTSLAQRIAAVKDKVHQFRNFLNQPATQSSVAGLSCVNRCVQ